MMLFKVQFDNQNNVVGATSAPSERKHKSKGYIEWTVIEGKDFLRNIYVEAFDSEDAYRLATLRATEFLQ